MRQQRAVSRDAGRRTGSSCRARTPVPHDARRGWRATSFRRAEGVKNRVYLDLVDPAPSTGAVPVALPTVAAWPAGDRRKPERHRQRRTGQERAQQSAGRLMRVPARESGSGQQLHSPASDP